ncbi:MAG: NHL repeat-containing protein [Armatimonadota bacterium]
MNTTDKRNPGNGFIDHGVATPISNHRGIVATVDGDGRDTALVWLFDHRGGYALLMVDADTGQSHEIPVPFPCGGDCPYASILSSRNLFYSHYNGYFVEFDTAQRVFTFVQQTFPQMAMGMTEDDRGRIWSVTYPDSGVVCFDPETRELRDYGSVHQENWQQYQRYVAADDAGWIYFALGNTASQIIMLDPESGEATPVLPEEERVTGPAYLYRDLNGKVYGQALEGAADGWYELYQGKATKIGTLERKQPKPIITSSQGLFHDRFPDGRILKRCDLTDRVIAVEDPATGKVREHAFDYSTDGAHIMGLAAAPDGTVCGGTAFPMRFFSFNPRTGAWINRPAYLQFNTVARQGDRFFFGGYIHGFLLEWDPSRPWVDTVKGDPNGNPRWLIECEPDINRPHKLLAHPDGKTLVLAGTPGYGYTGGGLLFWDRETETGTLVRHTEILPEHSTMSLVALPGGKLLGGSTTDPGTGGERKAKEAELYVMDMASKRVEWHEAVIPGVQGYVDMCLGANGVVYGIADGVRFFAFDPTERRLLHIEETEERFGPTGYQQGQRKLVQGPDGVLYALFLRAITRVNLETHQPELLIEPPVPVQFGGDILDGRLYFAAASHLYSWGIRP